VFQGGLTNAIVL